MSFKEITNEHLQELVTSFQISLYSHLKLSDNNLFIKEQKLGSQLGSAFHLLLGSIPSQVLNWQNLVVISLAVRLAVLQSRRPSFCPITEKPDSESGEDSGKTAVVFSLKNEVGCLVKALRLFQVRTTHLDSGFSALFYLLVLLQTSHPVFPSYSTSSSPSTSLLRRRDE